MDLLNTIRHLKELGIEVRFEKENIYSLNGDGELMLTILASFAQEESRSISENCKWGIRKRYIVFKAEDDQNKSLLLSQAYEAERLRLPPALAELPEEPNRNVDELSYAYWLGYIYRCECLLHEESSRMVYGAFEEPIMHRAYQELLRSPLGEGNLIDSAVEICMELDRLLVEKIWPEKSKRQRQLQVKELERPAQPKIEGSMTNATQTRCMAASAWMTTPSACAILWSLSFRTRSIPMTTAFR